MPITVADVLSEINRQLAAGKDVALSHEQAELVRDELAARLTQALGPGFHIEHDRGRG